MPKTLGAILRLLMFILQLKLWNIKCTSSLYTQTLGAILKTSYDQLKMKNFNAGSLGVGSRQATVLSYNKCLVLKTWTTFKYRLELWQPDIRDSKIKCWYSNNCLHFLKRAVQLYSKHTILFHHYDWKIIARCFKKTLGALFAPRLSLTQFWS